MIPGRQAQLEQGVVLLGLELRGKHSGRRAPRLTALSFGVQQQHATTGQGQLPGASGTYRATTHHDNIVGSLHLYFL